MYLLFEGDSSPFVDERFKTYQRAKEYARFNSTCGAYIPKHGCQDWLFKFNDVYTGILHLYDLSLENFADNDKRAWIGFAISEKFRNMNIASRAVNQFTLYIFDYYPAIDFIHSMTLQENIIARAFLKKCGFELDDEERLSKEHVFFILRRA